MGIALASAKLQPVKPSATGFINVIRAARSTAITASPILEREVANHSRLSNNSLAVFSNCVTEEWYELESETKELLTTTNIKNEKTIKSPARSSNVRWWAEFIFITR